MVLVQRRKLSKLIHPIVQQIPEIEDPVVFSKEFFHQGSVLRMRVCLTNSLFGTVANLFVCFQSVACNPKRTCILLAKKGRP